MKKSLVLAMAMALGVTATAFAANPFSDVPAGHWAYASVAKLAAAGIVDGYPDGTFGGDDTMTRYEMAQIVAKALAKGAIGADDKLVAEFASELDNLGVRVAKLEKNADNVKITGQFRVGYKAYDEAFDFKNANGDTVHSSNKAEARTRLFLNGAINDNWTYGAMIENTQIFNSNAEENTTKFRRAFVTGDIAGVKVTAGRQAWKVGAGYVMDQTGSDALRLDFGKVLKTQMFVGRLATDNNTYNAGDGYKNTYGINFNYDENKLIARAAWYHVEGNNAVVTDGATRSIYSLGLGYHFTKDLTLYAEYQKASDAMANLSDKGWATTLSYKGAKAAKKGTWGAYASYYDQAGAVVVDHTSEGVGDFANFGGLGVKGYEIGANYTIAKNIVADVSYYDLEAKENSNVENKMIWTRVQFNF